MNTAEPAVRARQRLPFVREIGRGHRIGDRASPRRRRSPTARIAPAPNFAAGDPYTIEQLLQMELRMRGFAAATLVRTKRIPLSVGEDIRQPQARQDRRSFGHPGDARNQRRNRWRSGGDSCRDCETGGRLKLPALGEPAQQQIAPLGKVDRALIGTNSGPGLKNQFELGERLLPMLGKLLAFGDRGAQRPRIDLLDRQGVERARQVRREAQPFRRTLAMPAHDRCKCQ